MSPSFATNDPEGHPLFAASFLPQPLSTKIDANKPISTNTNVALRMLFINDLRPFYF